jgi:DNA polymerase alpha subunit A
MGYEYQKKLYNQLLYFASLWDVDKAKKEVAAGSGRREWKRWRSGIGRGSGLVGGRGGYLRKCGRQWVAMDGLFGFALKGA